MEIKNRFTGNTIYEAEVDSIKILVEMAIEAKANLSEANLSGANLSGANLSGANLSGADLSGADLSEANLSEANLSWANLSWANLSEANLSWANLSEANLSGADLDFSSGLQFRCNSFGFKAGKRLAAQIAYHFCRIDFSGCEEAEKSQEDLKALANKFHRVEECGEIK